MRRGCSIGNHLSHDRTRAAEKSTISLSLVTLPSSDSNRYIKKICRNYLLVASPLNILILPMHIVSILSSTFKLCGITIFTYIKITVCHLVIAYFTGYCCVEGVCKIKSNL